MTTLDPVAELNQLVSELRSWNTFVFGGNASQQGGVGMMKQQMLDRLAPIADALSSLPEQPVAWLLHDDPELGDYLTRSKDAAERSGLPSTPLYAAPSHPAAVAVTDVMKSCAALLETLAEDAEKDGRVADWSMMSVMAEKARAALVDRDRVKPVETTDYDTSGGGEGN